VAKRLFDIVFAALALLLLSPVLWAVALWIRLDTPGPVLFRQQRVGQGGRLFAIYKFRTMHVDAEAAGMPLTIGADPRVTHSGAWLRRTKVDELPQFINVLRGDMSVVGPRPEVPRYVARYPAHLRDIVLSMRPGITDLASIAFRAESELLANSIDPEREYVERILPIKLRYASQYARTRSLWLDMRIIGWTVLAVLNRPPTRLPDPAD
jgi:lipopolysaccharide/colanic/teichoic acid biosynthesis glycosyltransferase